VAGVALLAVVGLFASTGWGLAVCSSCGTIGSVVDCYNTVVTVFGGGYC
jgi:hypothetical protein